MRAPRPIRDSEPSGFVLVGVVIFVLALTIIGLSLLSLSGYEADFLQRSQDGEQAYQSAMGGIERAKFALCVSPCLLESVGQNLPAEGVVAATATQVQSGVPVSTGPINWNSAVPVVIQVTAAVVSAGGDTVKRTVQGSFSPRLSQNYYAKVVTTSREIVVENFHEGHSCWRTVRLYGAVWEGISPTDTLVWKPRLDHWPDSIRTTPVPTPDLDDYFISHPVSAATPAPYNAANETYTLLSPSGVQYFCAPAGNTPTNFYLSQQTALENKVRVQGLVVWEFPHGVRFEQQVRVSGAGGGAGNGCLVMVAGQVTAAQLTWYENDPEMGIRLFGGLIVEPGISVILVSDGRVYVQHHQSYDLPSMVPDIAIYARSAFLTGPERYLYYPHPPQRYLDLQHSAAGDLDNTYIDLLASLGALPGTTSANTRSLALLPGTWRACLQ